MDDHIAALEAALHTEAMNLPLEVLFGVLAEVKELREELAAEQARAELHADLGRRTAEALGIPLEEGRAHMPEVAGRMRAEVASLKTVMVAAAEELAAHWNAHCDADGYGPTNLLRRLEEGIPSEYGYTAGAFERLRAENEALKRPPTDAQIVELAAAAGIEQQVRHSGGTYVLPTPVLRRFVEMVLAAQAVKERTS